MRLRHAHAGRERISHNIASRDNFALIGTRGRIFEIQHANGCIRQREIHAGCLSRIPLPAGMRKRTATQLRKYATEPPGSGHIPYLA